MNFVTNGKFAIPLIPECKEYSIREWAKSNNLLENNTDYSQLEFILPYRSSYDRIIRGISADLHGLMLDQGIVDLNNQDWDDVKHLAIPFIITYFNSCKFLPVDGYYHSLYYTYYLGVDINIQKVFEVNDIDNLPNYIKHNYGIETGPVPSLPNNFYTRTVPYWEIDTLYKTNENTKQLIDAWCLEDQKRTVDLTTRISNLFVST